MEGRKRSAGIPQGISIGGLVSTFSFLESSFLGSLAFFELTQPMSWQVNNYCQAKLNLIAYTNQQSYLRKNPFKRQSYTVKPHKSVPLPALLPHHISKQCIDQEKYSSILPVFLNLCNFIYCSSTISSYISTLPANLPQVARKGLAKMANLTGIRIYGGRMSTRGMVRVITMLAATPAKILMPTCVANALTFFQKALRNFSGTNSGLAIMSWVKFSGVTCARPSIMPGFNSKALGTLPLASFYLVYLPPFDILVDTIIIQAKRQPSHQGTSIHICIEQKGVQEEAYPHLGNGSGQWGLLILLLKKSLMMRRRPIDQDPDLKFHLDSSKELQLPLNKRFSLGLQDCSAVLDSPANHNLMDTNQISWLEKFAQENQKMCNSRLFDEGIGMGVVPAGPSVPPAQGKNEMKFSFNMNYQHEQQRKKEERPHHNQQKSCMDTRPLQREPTLSLAKDYSTRKLSFTSENILSEIQNTQETAKRGRKDSQVGSIKKNAKPKPTTIPQISSYDQGTIETVPVDMLDDMDKRLNKALNNHRSAYVDLITNKQNQKLYSEKSMGHLLPQNINTTGNIPTNNTASSCKLTSTFDNILKEHRRGRDLPTPPPIQTKPIPISTATPSSASTTQQTTPPSRPSALQILFSLLDKTQTGKLSKFNCAIDCLPEEFKYILGTILTNIKFKQYSYNKREFLQSCEKMVRQIDSNEVLQMMKDLQEKEKTKGKAESSHDVRNTSFKASFFEDRPMPKNKQSLQSQMPKETKSYNQIFQNTSKTSTLASKYDLSYEPSRMNQKSSESTRKYSELPPKTTSLKQVTFEQHFTFYPKQKPQQVQSLLKEEPTRRRSINVTQSMLQDHKKSLQSLKKLNERMQSCLSTNILSEHSKSGLSHKDSLSFDELVKHI